MLDVVRTNGQREERRVFVALDGETLRRLIAEGRSDPLQAALGFALSRPEASAVLVGVASASEMSAVVAAAMSPPPDLDWDEMALDDPEALDPGAWAAA